MKILRHGPALSACASAPLPPAKPVSGHDFTYGPGIELLAFLTFHHYCWALGGLCSLNKFPKQHSISTMTFSTEASRSLPCVTSQLEQYYCTHMKHVLLEYQEINPQQAQPKYHLTIHRTTVAVAPAERK